MSIVGRNRALWCLVAVVAFGVGGCAAQVTTPEEEGTSGHESTLATPGSVAPNQEQSTSPVPWLGVQPETAPSALPAAKATMERTMSPVGEPASPHRTVQRESAP
jgi:hypothetical protein